MTLYEPVEGHTVSSLTEGPGGWVLVCECGRRLERGTDLKARIAHGHHLGIVRSRRSLAKENG